MSELTSGKNVKVQQVIPTTFSSPKLIKVLPYADRDADECYVKLKRGIPDPWLEYLILKDTCKTTETKNIPYKVACDNIRITKCLWRDFGVSLEQGIPDPWKIMPIIRDESLKEEKSKKQNKNEKIQAKESSTRDKVSDEKLQGVQTKEENPQESTKNSHERVSCQEKCCTCPKIDEGFLPNQFSEVNEINACAQYFPPLKMQNRGIFGRKNPLKQTKLSKVMKGALRKCRSIGKPLFSDIPEESDVNFVCYRCNYPYFRVCRVRECLQHGNLSQNAEVALNCHLDGAKNGKIIDKFGKKLNVERDKNSRIEKIRGKLSKFDNLGNSSDTGRCSETSEASKSRKSHNNMGSVTSDSFVELPALKASHRGKVMFLKNSGPSLKSKNSSERLKKYIYNWYPPVIELLPPQYYSGEKLHNRQEYGKKTIADTLESKNVNKIFSSANDPPTSDNDNSSIKSEFSAGTKNYSFRSLRKSFSDSLGQQKVRKNVAIDDDEIAISTIW